MIQPSSFCRQRLRGSIISAIAVTVPAVLVGCASLNLEDPDTEHVRIDYDREGQPVFDPGSYRGTSLYQQDRYGASRERTREAYWDRTLDIDQR